MKYIFSVALYELALLALLSLFPLYKVLLNEWKWCLCIDMNGSFLFFKPDNIMA